MDEKIKEGIIYLFYHAEPVKKEQLFSFLSLSEGDKGEYVKRLNDQLSPTGLSVVDDGVTVAIQTDVKYEELVQSLIKKDEETPLSKAMREVLAIITYAGPIKRTDLDFIRAVNSHFILRRLSTRGLIIEEPCPKDKRQKQYRVSAEAMQHLGIKEAGELPDRGILKERIYEGIEEMKERMNVE